MNLKVENKNTKLNEFKLQSKKNKVIQIRLKKLHFDLNLIKSSLI